MNSFHTFLNLERQQAGWRFYILWVVATNIGFFSGLELGKLVSELVQSGNSHLANQLMRNTLSASVIGYTTGLAQALVLRRHGLHFFMWIVSTCLGWAAGIFIAGYIIFSLDPTIQANDFFNWIVPAAFIAGAVVGIPQFFVLKQGLAKARWWWILVSSLGWGIQIPGLFPGWVLTRFISKPKI